jgi:hypothetical protein
MNNQEIVTQVTGLTSSEQNELYGLITSEWSRLYAYSRKDIWRSCFNVYNQKFSLPLRQQESWIQNIRVFIPTIRTLVNALEPAMTNMLLSSDKYINIKADPILEDCWTDIVLVNDKYCDAKDHNDFSTNTQKAILQAAITGDNYSIVRQTGPYFESKTLSLTDIVISPLREKINTSNKILKFLKSPFDLMVDRQSGVPYFNIEDLEDQRLNLDEDKRYSQESKNPHDRSDRAQLGAGLEILEAHLYHHKFSSGKVINNTVVSVVVSPYRIIRFETNINIDRIIHNTWNIPAPGVYYGTGIIEPTIPSINYVNTLMTAELVGLMLDAMSGYTYNITDAQTRTAVKKGKFQISPFALIGVGPNANLQPFQRPTTRRSGQEFFNLIKQELIEVTGADTPVSGINSVGGFPESNNFRQLQYQANSSKISSHAKWWDKAYMREHTFRKLKELHQSMFEIADDGTGQTITLPRTDLIRFWLGKIGWEAQKIETKLKDPRFLSEFAKPIEFAAIEIIGTQTSLNKQEDLQSLVSAVTQIRPEQAPFIKWPSLTREVFKRFGVKNVDDFVLTEDEVQQMAQQQATDGTNNEDLEVLINAIESGVNPDTGEPLSPEDIEFLKQQYEEMSGQPYDQTQNDNEVNITDNPQESEEVLLDDPNLQEGEQVNEQQQSI